MRVRFVVGKVIGALSTIVFVVVFDFFLFRVVNDDPVNSMFRGRNLTPAQLDRLRVKFNLDGSKWEQFVAYVNQLLHGDLGYSLKSSRPVIDVIGEAIWPTILLVGTSTLIAMIGIPLGYRAGWRRGSRFDAGATSVSMLTYAMPEYWIGMVVLGVFAASLGWFPVGGLNDPGSTATGIARLLDQLHHMILPAIVLAIAYIGEYMIVARSAMIDTTPRGLPAAGAREGPPRCGCAPQARAAERAAARGQPVGDQLRLHPQRCDRCRVDLLVAGHRPADRSSRSAGPTSRCCRVCSC